MKQRRKLFSESPEQKTQRRTTVGILGGITTAGAAGVGYLRGKKKIEKLKKSKNLLEKSIEADSKKIKEGFEGLSKNPGNKRLAYKIANQNKAVEAKKKGLKAVEKTLKKVSPKKRALIGAGLGITATLGGNEYLKRLD